MKAHCGKCESYQPVEIEPLKPEGEGQKATGKINCATCKSPLLWMEESQENWHLVMAMTFDNWINKGAE